VNTPKEFEDWFSNNHPWDWFKDELGDPVPTSMRIRLWEWARAAWTQTESRINERRGHSASGEHG